MVGSQKPCTYTGHSKDLIFEGSGGTSDLEGMGSSSSGGSSFQGAGAYPKQNSLQEDFLSKLHEIRLAILAYRTFSNGNLVLEQPSPPLTGEFPKFRGLDVDPK